MVEGTEQGRHRGRSRGRGHLLAIAAPFGHDIDSVTASRAAAILFLASIVVGIVCGLATWLFVAASHYGIELLWHALPEALPGIPAAIVSIAVVSAMTVLATGIVVLSRGRPADMGRAEAEFDREGRIGYDHLPAGIGFSLTSLWSGAAIGPEAALIDLNGAIGTWLGDRFSMGPRTGSDPCLRRCRRCVRRVLRGRAGRGAARRGTHQPQVGQHQPDPDRRGARRRCFGMGGLRAARRTGDLADPAVRAVNDRQPRRPDACRATRHRWLPGRPCLWQNDARGRVSAFSP